MSLKTKKTKSSNSKTKSINKVRWSRKSRFSQVQLLIKFAPKKIKSRI